MKVASTYVSLALSLLFVVSCDKPKRLDAERVRIDMQREAIQRESDEYARKLKILESSGTMRPAQTERVAQEIEKKVAGLEAEAASKLAKWQNIESELTILQTRVDAWKAKNLK